MTADFSAALVSHTHWLSVGITIVVTMLSVGLHYEALEQLTTLMPKWTIHRRQRILALIWWILSVHIVEIWLFGGAIYLAVGIPGMGAVTGGESFKLLDAMYFSATTYSTAGYGELVATGPVRLLVGMESLVGLVLITWSASFTYLEMQRYWRTP